MKKIFHILPFLALAGCNQQQPENQWQKQGASPKAFYQDNAYCKMTALQGNQLYPYLGARDLGYFIISEQREGAIYENCLASKGWYKVRSN